MYHNLTRLGHIRAGYIGSVHGERNAVWKVIWSLGGPPKLSHFLWRACTNSVATQGRLYDRHVADNGLCILCGHEQESIVHALFDCPEVQQVWENSPFQVYLQDAPKTSFLALFSLLMEKTSRADLLSCSIIAWAAWAFRNSVVFNEPWGNLQSGVVGFLRLVEDYKVYAAAVFGGAKHLNNYPSNARWYTPSVGRVKVV